MPGAIETLISDTSDFLETKAELVKLKTVDRASEIVSTLISKMTIFTAVIIFLISINTAVALVLGDWLGKSYYGFFIVAGLYGIAGLFLYAFRNKWLKKPFYRLMVDKLLNNGL